MINPQEVCANPACKHYRFQHEGGPCQEWKGTDPSGKKKIKCDCPVHGAEEVLTRQ